MTPDEMVERLRGARYDLRAVDDAMLTESANMIEALARDAERMDWIDRAGMEEGCGFRHIAYGDYRFYAHQHFGGAKYPLARQVIDAARAQDTQRGER